MDASRLIDVLESLRLGKGPPSGSDEDPDGDVGILRLGDVNYEDRSVDWSELMRVSDYDPGPHHFLQRSDILIVGRGSRRTAIFVTDPPPRTVADRTFYVARPNRDRVVPAFLAWYLNEARAQHYLDVHAQGTSIKALKKSALERLPVPCADLDVQNQIAEVSRLLERERDLVCSWMERRGDLVREALRRLLKR